MKPRAALALGAWAALAASVAPAGDRVLVVGVEKYSNPLVPETPGCVRDAQALADFAVAEYGFPRSGVKVLVNEQATAAGIVREFREWLLNGTQPGDRVLFAYAGHGSQLPDDNGDEADGLDETLAPWDVDPETGANEIRDDVFEKLIAELSGRRAVCVFDCCHSGTISRGIPRQAKLPRGGGARYLPRPDQFKAFFQSGTRSLLDSYVVGPDASRNLALERPFVGGPKSGSLAGVVVVSAAKSTQRAYPLEAEGTFRGALSYVFAELQTGRKPTLGELKTLLPVRIQELQRSGRLDGDQQPEIDVVSTVPLDSQPLFGSWEQAAAVALANPLSGIHLDLRGREGRSAFRHGEKVSYEVTTSAPGYLYLLAFSQNDVATVIFPNSEDLDNRVAAGSVSVPRSRAYTFDVEPPYGRDVVVALLSADRLNLGDKEAYTWSEVFERVNLAGLREAVASQTEPGGRRGIGVKKGPGADPSGWQAASVVIETRP